MRYFHQAIPILFLILLAAAMLSGAADKWNLTDMGEPGSITSVLFSSEVTTLTGAFKHNSAEALIEQRVDSWETDFVFGASGMDDQDDPDQDRKFMFDKSKGSFYAGYWTSNEIDDANRGTSSFAAGNHPEAGGSTSVSLGFHTIATGDRSVAVGTQTQATGPGSISIGRAAHTTGTDSVTISSQSATGVVTQPNVIVLLANKIGVGTTNPVELLDINGTMECKAFTVNGSSWALGDLFSNGGDSAEAARTLGNKDKYNLGILTSGETRIHIKDSGEIGIATTNPLYKLSLNGHFGMLSQTEEPGSNGAYGILWVRQSDGQLMYMDTIGNTYEVLYGSEMTDYFRDGGEDGGADRSLGNTDHYDLAFETDNAVRLHIDKDGNIGIGTQEITWGRLVIYDGPSGSGEPLACDLIIADDSSTGVAVLCPDASYGSYKVQGPAGYASWRVKPATRDMEYVVDDAVKITLYSSGTVEATAFKGDGSQLTNVAGLDDVYTKAQTDATIEAYAYPKSSVYTKAQTDGTIENYTYAKADVYNTQEIDAMIENTVFTNGGDIAVADRSLGNTTPYAMALLTDDKRRVIVEGNTGVTWFGDPETATQYGYLALHTGTTGEAIIYFGPQTFFDSSRIVASYATSSMEVYTGYNKAFTFWYGGNYSHWPLAIKRGAVPTNELYYGKLYIPALEPEKLIFQDEDGNETDLTAGGSGGTSTTEVQTIIDAYSYNSTEIYTKTEIADLLAPLTTTVEVIAILNSWGYSSTEILALLAPLTTTTEVQAIIDEYSYNSTEIYTKSEVATLLIPLATTAEVLEIIDSWGYSSLEVYTKTETDNLLAPLTTTVEVQTIVDAYGYNSTEVYTKAETDATIEAYAYSKEEADSTIEAFAYSKFATDATIEAHFLSNGPWRVENNLVRPNTGCVTLATDDFVFGAPLLVTDGGGGDMDYHSRFFFDKSKSAFRAGYMHGDYGADDHTGTYSVSLGYNNFATGEASVALGYFNGIYANFGFAAGKQNFIGTYEGGGGQDFSVVMGYQNTSLIGYGTAVGLSNTVQTIGGSIALGSSNTSSGIALGNSNSISGMWGIALGGSNTVSDQYGCAIGYNNNVSGQHSVVGGVDHVVAGVKAAVFGYENTVPAHFTAAFGHGLKVYSYASLVCGQYNTQTGTTGSWVATDPLFVVGNGSADGDRNDTFVIKKSGYVTSDSTIEALAFKGDGSQLTGVAGDGTSTAEVKIIIDDYSYNSTEIYTKAEVDATIEAAIAGSTGKSTTEIEAIIDSYTYNSTEIYTTSEVDAKIAAGGGGKNTAEIEAIVDAYSYNSTEIYTKAEINATIEARSQFEKSGSLVRPNSGEVVLGSDSFLWGSYQMEDTANPLHDDRFFFEKGKGAFRAGRVTGTQWNSRGNYSFASGYNCTASGSGSTAMGDASTASGSISFAAGRSTASNSYAAALGYSTASNLYSFASGNTCVASGNTAVAMGSFNTARSDYSVAFGRNITVGTSDSNAEGSFGINLGSSIQTVTQANSMVIMGGKVGINTTAPNAVLDVQGAVIFNEGGVASYDVRMEGDTEQNLFFLDSSTNSIGIGTAAPLSLLSVSGEVRINQPGTATATAIGVTAAGVLSFISSSERFKKDIELTDLTTDGLYRLNAKNYRFKNEAIQHVGLIAEDVAEQYPTAAQYDPEGKVQSFDDKAMIALMIEALKQQKAEIEALKKAVEKLEGED
jgi:hypothetical protein